MVYCVVVCRVALLRGLLCGMLCDNAVCSLYCVVYRYVVSYLADLRCSVLSMGVFCYAMSWYMMLWPDALHYVTSLCGVLLCGVVIAL